MKVLITVSTVLYRTKDNKYWIDGIYSNSFFDRYLKVFDMLRLLIRVVDIDIVDVNKYTELDCSKIEIFEIPYYHGPWEYAKKYFQIKQLFKKIIQSCDCGIFRIPDDITFGIIKLMNKCKKPYLVENVSDSWDFFRPGTFKTILRPFMRIRWYLLQKKACKKANCVSYVTEKYLQKRYPSNCNEVDRFETNYTSADMFDFFYLNSRKKEDFFTNGIIKLVNVSTINSFSKGHKEMIDSILILKNKGYKIKMTFVGGGTMIDYFKEYAKKLDLEDNIQFLGNKKEYKDIVSILSQNDIFVFPSKTEGLPRAVIEAMAAGLPCISCNVGGIPELIDNEYLYDFNDKTKLVKLIENYILNVDNLVEQSNRNFIKSKKYSYNDISKRRMDIYKKLKNQVTYNYK